MDPPLAPTVRSPGCPLAPPNDQCYGGVGVSLGDCVASKPQKVGDCKWTRCPSKFRFEARSQRYRPFLVLGLVDTTWAIFGHFLAVSRTYCGVRGQQKALCHKEVKVHMECSNVSIHLAVLNRF